MSFDRRLFERDMSDDDYLIVRLGSGRVKAGCGIEITEKECIKSGDPLAALPELLAREYEYIPEAPVTVDLKNVTVSELWAAEKRNITCLSLLRWIWQPDSILRMLSFIIYLMKHMRTFFQT